MEIRELRTDGDITAAFPLMKELRDRISAETFLAEVRRQQAQGYRLLAGFAHGSPVVLAGIRRTHTLSRGDHLFVDDLVSGASVRGTGYGRAMMEWVGQLAAAERIPRIYLDARITAKGFYEKLGFTFHTSIPCWIDVDRIA
jgi:GNAT superfamily N-acetyltransferase